MEDNNHNSDGALAVIYDSNDNFIKKTIITSYDKRLMNIEISDKLKEIKTGARLNILIIHENRASTFHGILRRLQKGVCEITLFDEQKRAGRAAKRFKLGIPAVINTMIINKKQEHFTIPLEVIIDNLSSSGAYIKSPLGGFEVGHIVQLQFSMNEQESVIYGKIVRVEKNVDSTFGCGCQLLFMDKDEE